MNQKSLSNWIKGIIIGMGICGLIILAAIGPYIMYGELEQYPEMKLMLWAWMITFWVLGIPCYTVLVLGWKIATNIGKDNSFCEENARLLKSVSLMAVIDCGILFVMNIVFLFMNITHPSIIIASLFVIFIGIAIAVASATLSHLVLKASILQEQSDLTI